MPRKIETGPASEPTPERAEEEPAQETQEVSPEKAREREDSAYFLRHSQAEYKTSKQQLATRPQEPYDTEKQIIPDLTEAGVELAQQEAEKFLDNFNSETDALFFVSSTEARALETANIFRKEAHKKGFEVIKPEHVRSELVEEIGEGEIRAVDTLSLRPRSPLVASVFTPQEQLSEINWGAVDKATKEKWHKAREIVDSDDYGSWGANFFHHGEAIQAIFPELKTARDLHQREFKNMLKLLRFGAKKAKESGIEKNIKIIGFGHEDFLAVALEQYFGEHAIGNLEVINFKVEDDKITAAFKGKKREINSPKSDVIDYLTGKGKEEEE